MVTYKPGYWNMVAVYSAAHFFVDFSCAFLMFRNITAMPDGFLCVLLYNFCAFALQMPFGIVADKVNRNHWFAIGGCILVAFAFLPVQFPMLATVVLGIGNALFHIGGGVDVLNISEKKMGALGVFVSPGAFGIYFGKILGTGSGFPAVFYPIAMAVTAILIFAAYKAQRGTYPKNAAFSLEGASSAPIFTAGICLFSVVCLRSFAGLTMDFSWKTIGSWGLVLISAVVLGKTLGGFAADRFGLKRTVAVSLGLAALLFLFPKIPLAGVAAVLLFNMTMPITLWAMAKMMPGAKGFAFGLLTFALFIGFLPVYRGVAIPPNAAWLFAPLAAGSLVILMAGLKRAKL